MNDDRKKCLMIYKKKFAYIQISFLASHAAYELALLFFKSAQILIFVYFCSSFSSNRSEID